MKLRALIALVGMLALVLVGCRSNPVYNVSGAPVTTSTRNYSMSDVRGAILHARSCKRAPRWAGR